MAGARDQRRQASSRDSKRSGCQSHTMVQLKSEPLETHPSLSGGRQTTLCELLSSKDELEFHPIHNKHKATSLDFLIPNSDLQTAIHGNT
jgi:hypothetical protein